MRPHTYPLLGSDPELARYLRPDERQLAEQVMLPLHEITPGPLRLPFPGTPSRAFAGLVLEGMLVQSVQLGEHTGLCLLGPGDFIDLSAGPAPALISRHDLRATVRTRIVLFGDEFLLASRRWPRLLTGLFERTAEQSSRQLTQLLICQLPRVDERLLAMLWLVAETWGRVTPSGTAVPVRLTHGVLGGLIGARRSTVTLALKDLVERGAVVRQSDGFLLLERPNCVSKVVNDASASDPHPVAWQSGFDWTTVGPEGVVARAVSAPPSAAPSLNAANVRDELDRTVARLSVEHQDSRRRYAGRLTEMTARRELLRARRERITRQRADSPAVPSSG